MLCNVLSVFPVSFSQFENNNFRKVTNRSRSVQTGKKAVHFVFSTQLSTVSSYADILLDITLEHRGRIWTLGAQEHRGLELLTPNANRIPIMKEMLYE